MKGFTKLIHDFWRLQLNEHEKIVLIYLIRCADNKQRAFPSYKTIAKMCAISERTSVRAVESLINKHCITKQPGGNHKSNEYKLHPDLFY